MGTEDGLCDNIVFDEGRQELTKKDTIRFEQVDPNQPNYVMKKGSAKFVSWKGKLLELEFENGPFIFEPNLAHSGDERRRLWSSVGERGFGTFRIAGLLKVLGSHGLSASPLQVYRSNQ